MLRFLLLLTFWMFSIFPAFAQEEAVTSTGRKVLLYQDGRWEYLNASLTRSIPNLELPRTRPTERVISHTGYSFLYSEAHEQSRWVAYELTAEETQKRFERSDRFRPDPEVSSETASDADYRRSGYDRGHLAPASDMGWSEQAMEESFYYSNISPQEPSFNRGIWKKLEEQVRQWAIENEALYVVTGPVLTDQLRNIGPNKVSIPEYFFKALLHYRNGKPKAIAFLMPNAASKEPITNFAISIDSLEEVTGLDFFPALPDDQENRLEQTVCFPCWYAGKTAPEKEEIKERPSSGVSVQCQGITRAGNRCRNNTRNESGFCHVHEGQKDGANPASNSFQQEGVREQQQESSSVSVQCSGTTKKGTRCRRMTRSANGRCFQH